MTQNPKRLRRTISILLAGLLTMTNTPLAAMAKAGTDAPAPKAVNQQKTTYVAAPFAIQPAKGTAESGQGNVSMLPLNSANIAQLEVADILGKDVNFPSAFDLRKTGQITGVKDQGMRSSCWAHSILASAESYLLAKENNVDFSEWHLVYMSYWNTDTFEPDGFGTLYDQGGWDFLGINTLSQWFGPIYEADVPYETDLFDTMTDDELSAIRSKAAYHLQDAYLATNFEETQTNDSAVSRDVLKSLVWSGHALSVSYFADSKYTNEETGAYYCDDATNANHAVTLAGWDDSYSKENFNENYRPEHDGAWLIKNSWGPDFGKAGYYWISYEDKSMSDFCCAFLEPSDNYDDIYSLDTLGWNLSVAAGEEPSTTSYMSNLFTAEKDTAVCAASFYTTDNKAKYEITVYTDLKDPKDPTSGTPSAITTGVETFAGYHTVDLLSAVPVDEDETFSIVIRLENPKNAYPIATEAYTDFHIKEADDKASSYSSFSYETLTENCGEGQSFISTDGKTWTDTYLQQFDYVTYFGAESDEINEIVKSALLKEDLASLLQDGTIRKSYKIDATLGNVCIKAFTNDAGRITFSDRGAVAFPTDVTLTTNLYGASVFYAIDGGEFQPYTAPIAIDRAMELSAYAVKDGVTYPTATASYTQRAAGASSIVLKSDSGNMELSTELTSLDMELSSYTDTVVLNILSGASIKVNGEAVESSADSQIIPLKFGANQITVQLSGDGVTDTTYTYNITRQYITIDYIADCIYFDEAMCHVTTESGSVLAAEQTMSPFANQMLYYVTKDAPNKIQTLQVGNKPKLDLKLDTFYYNDVQLGNLDPSYLEKPDATLFMATTEDLSDAMSFHDLAISKWLDEEQTQLTYVMDVLPSETFYFFWGATDTAFASDPVVIQIPEAPAAPEVTVEIASAEEKSITVKPIAGMEYAICELPNNTLEDLDEMLADIAELFGMTDEEALEFVYGLYDVDNKADLLTAVNQPIFSDWSTDTTFNYLIPGTEYAIAARLPATDSAFASEFVWSSSKTTGERPPVLLNYQEETLDFDEDDYTVTYTFPEDTVLPDPSDPDGDPIEYKAGDVYTLKPDQSFSDFLGCTLAVIPTDGSTATTLQLPVRPEGPTLTFDYENDCTDQVMDASLQIAYTYYYADGEEDCYTETYSAMELPLTEDGKLFMETFNGGGKLEIFHQATPESLKSEGNSYEIPKARQLYRKSLQYTIDSKNVMHITAPLDVEYYLEDRNAEVGIEYPVWSDAKDVQLEAGKDYWLTARLKGSNEEKIFPSYIYCYMILQSDIPFYDFADINGDQEIDTDDAVLVMKHYAKSLIGESLLSEEQLDYADINGDDVVDTDDAVCIMKYYAKSLLTSEDILWDSIIPRFYE